MTLQAPAPFISLAQWVPVLQRWFPLRHAVMVGQSSLALRPLNAPKNALTRFNAAVTTSKEDTLPWLIAERSGPVNFYQNSLPAESGLLPDDALKCCWPGIKTMGQHQVDAVSLDAAAAQVNQHSAAEHEPNWLWLGCLPGAPLLRGAQRVLQQVDVVAVRVVLHPNSQPESSLAAAEHLLDGQGFVLCGVEPERNPQLGMALFVKDYPAAHAKGQRQINALSQTQAALQSQLKQAQQALQAQTQANEVETAAKVAEAQGRVAEQQAKEQALTKAQSLEADKVKLIAAKDQVLAQLQQLQQDHAQAQLWCDELAKAKEAEISARLVEIQAKAAVQVQLDQVKQALQVETDAKQAEVKAKKVEQQAKELAWAQLKQLQQDHAQAQLRSDELTKAKEAEISARLMEIQAKAAVQVQLDQVKQALQVETDAKQAEVKAKKVEQQAKELAWAQLTQLQQDHAQAQLRSDELTKAKEAETTALLVEIQAKAEMQVQLDQVKQALQVETDAKQAEVKAKKVEQQAKELAWAQLTQLQQDHAQAQLRSDELTKAKEAETTALLVEIQAKAEMQVQLDQVKQALQVETDAKLAEVKAKTVEQQAKEQALAKAQTLDADKAKLTELKEQVLAQVAQLQQEKAQVQQRCDELAKANEAQETTLTNELHSIKAKLRQSETLFQASLTIDTEAPTQLRFNSKSEGIYKNNKGLIKFDLPGNTPAYLVSNEVGDFDIAPKTNVIPLVANKAYEFTGSVVAKGSGQPVVWLFEYDETNKKINSHSYPTHNGEVRVIFKTQACAVSFAIGIRLGGAGSLNPQNTWFKFENSLAIDVAEAMQHSHAGFDKKLAELQTKLQKDQQSQNQNNLRQIESFLRLQNYCGSRMVLPDMHGWPVSPDLGVYIIRLVETGGFDAIVELGSGVSTLLIALALQKAADQQANRARTLFVSFEHLETYLQQTQTQLQQAQLSETVQLVHAPLVETPCANNAPAMYYDCQPVLKQLRQSITNPHPKLLVFVDGPPAATGPLARFPAMPAIEQAFEGSAEVHYLMDDYIRQDERHIVDQWQAQLEQQGRQVEKQELKQFEKQACLLITKAQL